MAAVANEDQPGTFDVATLDGSGPWVDWARQLGFEPAVLGGHGTPSIGGFGLAVLPGIIGLLRRERYSAIYVIGLRASVLLRLLKPFVGAPPLVHGIRWNPNSTSRLDKALRITERLLGGLVDFYVTNSNIAAKTLEDTAGIRSAKIATIFNGIDRVPAAGQHGGEKTIDLLTIANYAPRKGLLEYIERVILPLSLKRPDLRVMLVGRDDMHGAVQEKVKELNLTGNVICTGFQPDVSPLLAKARIFVLPSLWNEGCPTSLLEAMSWRLPVVAFSMDGIPELVDTGNDGTLLPHSDYAAMSSAIDSLLTSESERVRLGDNGHRKVASRFQLLHTARRHIEVFSALLQSDRRHMSENSEDPRENVDPATVAGFGDEWSRFDQSALSDQASQQIFEDYFGIFPWEALPADASGADIGCGSGRWAQHVAPRVGQLLAIDASADALAVARRELAHHENVRTELASVNAMPIADASLDFAYSLGVLHHVPDTQAALTALAQKLRPGAPFLVYLYYAFDNRGPLFRGLWQMSNVIRLGVSRLPSPLRFATSQLLAGLIYWPLARFAALMDKVGILPRAWPLAYYRDKPFYVMRTDALDRFGTRLEQRFTRVEIKAMLERAGFRDVAFSDRQPYWVALGFKD